MENRKYSIIKEFLWAMALRMKSTIKYLMIKIHWLQKTRFSEKMLLFFIFFFLWMIVSGVLFISWKRLRYLGKNTFFIRLCLISIVSILGLASLLLLLRSFYFIKQKKSAR